jgi:hypothetical protein
MVLELLSGRHLGSVNTNLEAAPEGAAGMTLKRHSLRDFR